MTTLLKKPQTIIMSFTIALYLVTPISAQQKPEQFYRGKTLTWISSTAPGQGGDMMTRVMVPYLAKETGAVIRYENMGTEEGVNWVYTRGPKDGLTMVSKNSNAVIANDILKAPGVRYESEKYLYITDLDPGAFVLAVSPKSKYRTLDDFRRVKALKGGGTSLKGALATAAAVTLELLEVDGKVVTGYKGSPDVWTAVMRSEIDFVVIRGSSITNEVKNGDLLPLFALPDEGSEVFKKIPSIRAFGVNVPKQLEDARDFVGSAGTIVAMPPGVPQDRVDYMRNVFQRLDNNEELRPALTKLRGVETDFVNGRKVQDYVSRLKSNKALSVQLEALLTKYAAIR
jgi:tripartite-type tricarboxylate transporter receptor subunit TctC